MVSKIVKRQMWHWFYFHLRVLAEKADYEIQSSSNAPRVNSRFHGWSFFCLPSSHALNSTLNTYIYIFIKKNENTIGPNYLHLASVCKKLNILTLAFSEGCSFPGVWHATTTKEHTIIPQGPSLELVLLLLWEWMLSRFWVQCWEVQMMDWAM